MLGSAVSAIGEDAQVQPFLDGVAARRYALTKDKAAFEEAVKRYKDRAEREVGIRNAADPGLRMAKLPWFARMKSVPTWRISPAYVPG